MNNKLRLLLPSGMAGDAYNVFKQCGYASEGLDREMQWRMENRRSTGKLNNNKYEGERAIFYVPRSNGVLAAIDNGRAEVGIVGEDAKFEYEFATGRGGGFRSFELGEDMSANFPKMRFSLVGKSEFEKEFLRGMQMNKFLEIVTSYPGNARKYFAENFPNFQSALLDLIESKGQTELMVGDLNLANIAFELVVTGDSLKKNGLIEYTTPSQPIPVMGIANNGAEYNRNEIRELTSRMEELSV